MAWDEDCNCLVWRKQILSYFCKNWRDHSLAKKNIFGKEWNYKRGVVKQCTIEKKQLCWNVISYLPGQLQNFAPLAALESGLGNGSNNWKCCIREVHKRWVENESTELENVYAISYLSKGNGRKMGKVAASTLHMQLGICQKDTRHRTQATCGSK